MSKTKLAVILVGIVLVVALIVGISWAAEPKKGGMINVALTGEPVTLDWQFVTEERTRQIASHVLENLVTIDEQGKVIPQLADSWKVSNDGLTYTFTLRKGVFFHNGKEMTAEDVKASLERYLKVARRQQQFAQVKEINATDKYTVVINLSEKMPLFLDLLSSPVNPPAIMPKEVVEGKAGGKVDLIGTGPFKFSEWVPGRYIELKAFDGYKPDTRFKEPIGLGGKREADVDTIRFVPVPESGARVSGLLTATYDFIEAVPAAVVKTLQIKDDVTVDKLMPYAWSEVLFNHANAPSNNLKFRQAIQAALNMKPIMEISSDGFYRLDQNIMYKELAWTSTAGKNKYNMNNKALAKKLLKEAGYKGEQVVFGVPTDYDWMYRGAVVMAEQLKAVGVNVKLVAADYGTIKAIRQDKKAWNMAVTGVIPEPSVHPLNFLEFFRTGPGAYGFYSNPNMDKLIEQFTKADSFAEQYKAWKSIQQFVYDDVIIIKWGDLGSYNALSKRIQGYKTFRVPRFWNVTVK